MDDTKEYSGFIGTIKNTIDNSIINADKPVEKDVVIEKKIDTIETKTKVCKIIFTNNAFTAVDFNGYGLEIPCVDKDAKEVEVKYTGDIGQLDFEIVG
jgi:hypothetical protein